MLESDYTSHSKRAPQLLCFFFSFCLSLSFHFRHLYIMTRRNSLFTGKTLPIVYGCIVSLDLLILDYRRDRVRIFFSFKTTYNISHTFIPHANQSICELLSVVAFLLKSDLHLATMCRSKLRCLTRFFHSFNLL